MPAGRTVAVPTESSEGLEAPRSGHTGRARTFTIVRVGEDGALGAVRVIPNPADEASGHGVVATMLVGEAVTDLIVAGIGEGMRTRLVPAGVRIWRDYSSKTVGDAVRSLAAGVLEPLTDADVHPGHHADSRVPPGRLN